MTDRLPPLPHDEDGGETTQSDPHRTGGYLPQPDMSARTRPVRPTREMPQLPATGHVQRVPPAGTPPTQPPMRRPATGSTPPYRKPVRPTDARRDSGLYLPLWSLVLMLVAVLAASFAVVMLIMALGSTVLPATREPVIRIITAVPTIPGSAPQNPTVVQQPGSETLSGQNPPASLSLEGPTLPAVVFTPTPQPIMPGSTVIVSGVGADELNIRDKAGVLASNILFRVKDGGIFTVVEGPMQSDGFTWWRIQNVTNPAEAGWAVANYLQVMAGQ